MCTTFLTYNLVQTLLDDGNHSTRLIDYPNLIRLNPNIPWKTRGNAALVIRIKSTLNRESLFDICKNMLLKHATSKRANSGLVIYEGKEVPERVKDFSRRALSTVLGQREANELFEECDMLHYGLRSKQGLVGALAGIGNTLDCDYTHELIAYRQDTSIPRKLDKGKVVEMSRLTSPRTFSSYDEEYDRVMIMPHGLDPVLCGIRGETASDVKSAFRMLMPVDNLLGWMIYRSNQGTGEHISTFINLADPKVYTSGKICGIVTSTPRTEKGGHVFFRVKNDEGEIECACYEPTGKFRKYALSLIPGDKIEAGGGVRKPTVKHSSVLNVEYFNVITLARKIRLKNPKCPNCKVSMSSEGRGQGYQCAKCGHKEKRAKKVEIELSRDLELKMYIPPLRAHRHLTKPLERYGISKKKFVSNGSLVKEWLKVFKNGQDQEQRRKSGEIKAELASF